jgi:hypothetical protein
MENDCPGIAGEDQEICQGDTVRLGTGCLPSPHPIDSVNYCYIWEPQEGLFLEDGVSPGLNEARPFAAPKETTTYTVYVTTDEGELIGEDEVTVVVKAIEGVAIAADGGTDLCEGTSSTLKVKVAGDINDYTIAWSTGASTPQIIVSQAGNYSVTLSDAGGCTAVDSIRLEAVGIDTLAITPENPVICNGSIDLYATEGFAAYQWIDPLGDLYSSYPKITVDNPGVYKVYALNENGCETVDSVKVTEQITDLTVSPYPAKLCLGGTLTMRAPEGFAAYTWFDIYENELGTGRFLEVDRTGRYILMVTDESGCSQTHEFFVGNSDAQDVEILPKDPSFCFTDDPTLVPGEENPDRSAGSCSSAPHKLKVSGDYTSILWSTGETTPSISITEPGVYSVTVTDENGCTNSDKLEVQACTSPDFELSPFPVHLCSDTSSIVVDVGAGYNLYDWSDGSSGQSLEISAAGNYGVTVTDANGCKASKDFSVYVLGDSLELDLKIFKPAALAGNSTTVVAEEDAVGAMAFLNIDNDDGDSNSDLNDKEVKGGDDDLMRLVVTLKPSSADTIPVYLKAVAGGGDVRIWKSASKKKGEEFELGNPVSLSEEVVDGDTMLTATYWVEGIKQHTAQRSTVLRASCNDNPECPVADEVSITIVGMAGLRWKGMGNGFAGPNNTQSNTLDTDNTHIGNGDTFSNGSPLQSKRVFPGGRIDPTGTSVSSLKDTVKLEARLSVAPVEPLTLYARAFDVDDPSAKGGDVDPNDKSKKNGHYAGTSNHYGGGLTYDKNQDNRRAPEGQTRKEGHFVNDTNDDGIVAFVFDGAQALETPFQVSIMAGDNYRAAAAFEKTTLQALENLDKRDGLAIVDPHQGGLFSGPSEIPNSHLFTTNVLTVWRLLHVEYQSMDNVDDQVNLVSGYIEDFKGRRASTTLEITKVSVSLEESPSNSSNLPSLTTDYSSVWHGQFENGLLYIGGGQQVINAMQVKSNGASSIRCSAAGMLPLPYKIFDSIGTVIATGEVTEIMHPNPNASFNYTLTVTSGGLGSIATNPSSFYIQVAQGQQVPLQSVSLTTSQVTAQKLSIDFELFDDDARMVDLLLPYDFNADPDGIKSGLKAYKDAFVETVDYGPTVVKDNEVHLIGSADIAQYYRDNSVTWNNTDVLLSSDAPGKRIWIAYVCSAFQVGLWRKDGDPDNEVGVDPINSNAFTSVNQGATDGSGTDDSLGHILQKGGQVSMIPFENIRDMQNQNIRGRSMAHEIGHQFGLLHYPINKSIRNSASSPTYPPNLMNFSLTTSNNGVFADVHLNLIRCRKNSPGLLPSL